MGWLHVATIESALQLSGRLSQASSVCASHGEHTETESSPLSGRRSEERSFTATNQRHRVRLRGTIHKISGSLTLPVSHFS